MYHGRQETASLDRFDIAREVVRNRNARRRDDRPLIELGTHIREVLRMHSLDAGDVALIRSVRRAVLDQEEDRSGLFPG
ncbi:MAG: hypothetical protein WD312_03270 [Candidatus Paceibacterota bacterium]